MRHCQQSYACYIGSQCTLPKRDELKSMSGKSFELFGLFPSTFWTHCKYEPPSTGARVDHFSHSPDCKLATQRLLMNALWMTSKPQSRPVIFVVHRRDDVTKYLG